MSLQATVALARGSLGLDATVDVDSGEVVAMVGPNGAGKTTFLRALAGLEVIEGGRIVLDGEVLDDPLAGTWIPVHRRSVGVVFQDYLLFPHLTVLDNVASGLVWSGVPKAAAAKDAMGWLDRFDLTNYAAELPARLSGGQAQRVALARALALGPRLLLLDEPLAALDAGTKAVLRSDLRRHLAAFPGIRLLVTHDPLDAMALADRLVVLESGRIVQAGTLAEVAARPRSRYVADLVGRNLYRGRGTGHTVEIGSGGRLAVADRAAGDVFALVHPRAVALHRGRPEGSARNVWSAAVAGLDDEGDRFRVRLAGEVPIVAEVTPAAVAELALVEGSQIWVSVKASEVAVYPA